MKNSKSVMKIFISSIITMKTAKAEAEDKLLWGS
jgi:hypothetical protein